MSQGKPAEEFRQPRYTRPRGATEVLLLRHGESRAASAERPFPLVDGQGDPELHPSGREQAQRAAQRLCSLPISAVYVTNLRRTAETAAPLCDRLNMTPIVEPDLREVHLGEWEGGLYRIKARQGDPVYRRMLAEQRWDVIPGGESHESLDRRILGALWRMAGRHPDQMVLAVVHGGVIGHIVARATGAQPFAFHGADNGSLSHVVLTEGRIVVRCFNDTSHLADAVSAPGASQLT